METSRRGKAVDINEDVDGERVDHRWLSEAAAQLAGAERVSLPTTRFKELLTLARRALGPRRVGPEEEKRESTF